MNPGISLRVANECAPREGVQREHWSLLVPNVISVSSALSMCVASQLLSSILKPKPKAAQWALGDKEGVEGS